MDWTCQSKDILMKLVFFSPLEVNRKVGRLVLTDIRVDPGEETVPVSYGAVGKDNLDMFLTGVFRRHGSWFWIFGFCS